MASSSTDPKDRLQKFEKIERNIASTVQSAGRVLQELSKDKPVMKHSEGHTSSFLKTLQEVENELMSQINYLMQGITAQPHEGSLYSARKRLMMVEHCKKHVESRLSDLEKLSVKHQHLNNPQVQSHPNRSSLP